MSDEIRLEGLGVAPGVLDTIVNVATEGVVGVAGVGAPGLAGLVQKGTRKGTGRAVDVTVADDDEVTVTVHIQVAYGSKLREVAAEVQKAIASAIESQVGVEVAAVDVYVDGIVFSE
jgi:uncharacterized alkaline shock family protein YloU